MSNPKLDTIVFVGKTGSGKGTQAKLISENLKYKLFSTGDKFRELRLKETPLGRKVEEIYDAGLLMPHWLASFVFEEAILNLDDGDKIVFEGTGRTLEESVVFDEICDWLDREYIIFNLNVKDEEVIKRQKERGRDSLDEMDKIKRRLEEYRFNTSKSIDFFRKKGKLVEINGEVSPEEVHKEILNHLGQI